jgi:hypothetical protein
MAYSIVADETVARMINRWEAGTVVTLGEAMVMAAHYQAMIPFGAEIS